MEDLIKKIALKYYKESSIASINFANSRIIITIQNEQENKELADKLKAELFCHFPELRSAHHSSVVVHNFAAESAFL